MSVYSVVVLAQPDPNMPLNDDTVTPGFLGFGVVVAIGLALFFLIRSMNKRMGKIQAPSEADLKQQEWERAEAAKKAKADAAGPSDSNSGSDTKS
ncbi:hypothetical protein ACFQ07_21275 [Actinomadura adrarensis]|uniref:Uncharacterized protein n=1 Tax=Actinomadura adrarensis TaxID=1819600 RepID=A0ABW3CKH7_9ACTN